ncbi:MAG: hypothetical protein PHC99_05380 [Methylococcales bacterium]|nr:hypothetical protein [Methylococcales bacterium]
MSKFTALKNSLKKFSPVAIGASVLASADSAFAANPALGDVNTAIADGKEIVGAAASGLVTIAAVVAGVMLVVALLKR